MKILQVFNVYLNPGGEENSALRIADDLREGGHEVIQFWRRSDEWQGPGAPPKWRQPFLMWKNPAVLADLEKAHRRERPDVWILHNLIPVISLGVYGLARRLEVPAVQWLHNYRPISPSGNLAVKGVELAPEDRWIRWKETASGAWRGRLSTAWISLCHARLMRSGCLESVRAWIAVSDEMRALFLRAGWDEKRLSTLRHNWRLGNPTPQENSAGSYFLFLGRVIETKGVRFLVDLWQRPELKGQRLLVAGEGDLLNQLKRVSPSNVEWLGHVTGQGKSDLLRGCRAVLFPSLWAEPLSTVAYEAYDFSKAVISSDRGGMKEIVFTEETGLVVPAGDEDAWVRSITRLASDQELAASLGRQGRKWLEMTMQKGRWVQKFEEIIRGAAPEIDGV